MADCNNNVPDYIVLPGTGGGSGTPGPVGPAGPQGPPGVADLPLPAEDVSVVGHAPITNVQEAIDFLLYVTPVINSFTATKSTYELGESISALGFNWALNKTDITSQVITGPHVESGDELGVVVRSSTLTFSPNLETSSTFTLTVNDGTTIAAKNKNINFFNGVYNGNAVIPAVIDSNFINSLTKKLQSSRSSSFTSNAGANTYVWYAHAKSQGIASFKFGGFDGGMEAPSTISFTNSKGYVEDYYVYRSTNPQIGVVSVIVT